MAKTIKLNNDMLWDESSILRNTKMVSGTVTSPSDKIIVDYKNMCVVFFARSDAGVAHIGAYDTNHVYNALAGTFPASDIVINRSEIEGGYQRLEICGANRYKISVLTIYN